MGGCVVRISSILTIELEDASQRIPVLTQKREREKVEREKKRAEKQDGTAMDVDGGTGVEEEIPTYSDTEAPSLLPQNHYCDITELEAPYTDPATGLRYHDKSVYELIKDWA